MKNKIYSFADIEKILEEHKSRGQKVVHCHGVFDLLHPGHIRHFKIAKKQGDLLVVTITSDRFVNKGPGKPAFTEALRLESIAALEDVDYVVLNDDHDAVGAIKKIKPSLYVKGEEYKHHYKDVTGKISEEIQAVESVGGKIFYTEDIIFSSSSLINQFFDQPPEVTEFLNRLKNHYSIDDIIQKIESFSDLNVLVVGDAILDEYQFSETLGQSGKGLHMVVRCLEKELFLGGSLIVANHIAQFVKKVTLLTAVGKSCPHLDFIRGSLASNVNPMFTYLEKEKTLVKKRYVCRDSKALIKLFETYSGPDPSLSPLQTNEIVHYLSTHQTEYDLLLVCDFGNGFTNPLIVDALASTKTLLALNTQMNSGNRGLHAVTNYRRADIISLNESELRLAAHDKKSSLDAIASDIAQVMHSQYLSVTSGTKGLICYSKGDVVTLPPFTTQYVDRIGAGDTYFSLSSLGFAKKYPPLFSSFIGSVAAAMSIQMVGNKHSVQKASLYKFITRLLK